MPTVSLSFLPDPRSIAKARRIDLAATEAGVLVHTYFWMPVRLVVADIVVIRDVTAILYLAYLGLKELRRLPITGFTTLDPPTFTIHMSLRNADLTVRVGSAESRVGYSDILEEWERFSEQVRLFLSDELPPLKNHPEMGAWFRGEE